MTSRERLQKVLAGEKTDCVPVCPDISNMIPAKLTGLPFWDVYLYEKIPLWKAYINAAKHFGFDAMMGDYNLIKFDDLGEIDHDRVEVIVCRSEERIITQKYREANGKKFWDETVCVYYIDNPPSRTVKPETVRLPNVPDRYEEIHDRAPQLEGEEMIKQFKAELGDQGIVGVTCGQSLLLHNTEDIYDYYDDPEKYREKRDKLLAHYEKRFKKLMSLEVKPDLIYTGGSGSLVFQSPEIFRELGLPIVQKVTALCKEAGIPSHVHSCGPETELVKILSQESDLTVIDPLEVPPMGDCNLRELKRLYGDKIILKGNLHTTQVMLMGTVRDVTDASKKAIDDAAEGGGFILSTGDQCGRDTPEENLFAMIETARTYGKFW